MGREFFKKIKFPTLPVCSVSYEQNKYLLGVISQKMPKIQPSEVRQYYVITMTALPTTNTGELWRTRIDCLKVLSNHIFLESKLDKENYGGRIVAMATENPHCCRYFIV